MKDPIQVAIESIDALADDDLRSEARQLLANWIPEATDIQLSDLLEGYYQQAVDTSVPARFQLRHLLGELANWLRPPINGSFSREQLSQLDLLYRRLGDDWQTAQHVLSLLALQHDDDALGILVELLVDAPPPDSTAVALALGPLIASPPTNLAVLYPRLLDALAHRSVAAPVLDMANYLTRKNLLDVHPATDRIDQLETLLHGLNYHLEQLEQLPVEMPESLQQLDSQIDDSVALAVALCDAMAQIGRDTSASVLRLTCQLSHPRLRTEAAGALAQLGDEEGRRELFAMASEPVARLRVIQYAEELGIADQIDPALVTAAARAESGLALWLAQPDNVGIPPSSTELLDQCSQYWPGLDEPVDCFLFQFCYQFGEGQYQNIGIAAPTTAAVHANLEHLSIEEIYALFAGRDVEHEEICQWEISDLVDRYAVERAGLRRLMEESDFSEIQPYLFMQFFGDSVLVALASREQHDGIVVADDVDCLWLPQQDKLRPLSADDALNIYKGKKLLSTFNA